MDKGQGVGTVLMMTMLDFQESTHEGDRVLMREVRCWQLLFRE